MARELSLEERQRRSELARRLHSEGKFGGKEYGRLGGRPRKPRATELVAEEARNSAHELVDAFKDALDPANHPQVRVRAATEWLNIEAKEEELRMKEERQLEGLHRDALIARVAEKLGVLIDAGVVPDIVEGKVVNELESGE
jgi:hypothetical protein